MRRHAPEHRETSHDRTPARYCRQTEPRSGTRSGLYRHGRNQGRQAEAVRQLTVEKALQVRLQNEITRKERIPIDVVNEVTGQVFQSMAATIKSKRDKVLTEEVINELLAELRAVPDRLNWPGVKLTDLAQ
jgi:hypothetical protein